MGQTERRPPHDPVQLALVALANPKKSAVLVVGPPGSGKSRVLSEVQSQLDRSDAGRRHRLVAVDDVDLLDPPSLSLLADTLDRQAIRLVATVRTAQAATVLRVLRPLRPLAIVHIPPWRREDVAAFAAEQIGGVLDELTLSRLLHFSGGNALCLTELVDSGMASGRLHRHYDCWAWTGPLAVPPLTEARIAGRLEALPAQTRDVHATVALVGTAELPVLESVFSAAAVEAADDAGVLRVEQSGYRLQVRPSSPIEASVAVQTLSATRRRRLAGGYAAALLRQDPRQAVDPLGLARLLQLSAAPVPPELRLRAASAAIRMHDPAFAEALLVEHAGTEPAAASLAASAIEARGEPGRAAAVLAAASRDSSATAADRARLAVRRAMLQLLDGNEAAVRAAADPADRRSHRSALSLAAWTGDHPDAADGLGRVLGEQPDWTDVDTQQALVGVVALLAQAGRLEAAVATAAPAGDCLAGRFGFDPVQRLHLLAILGSCHLGRGHVEDADRYATALRQIGLAETWPYAYGLGALLGGRCALAGGRVRRAVLLLSESLVPAEGHSTAFLRPYALTQLALAYTLAGSTGTADRVLFDADRAVPARAPRLLRELAELTRAEILLARGRHSGALRTAAGVADRCRADGQALAAVSALHLCARIDPSAQTAERLAAVVGDTDYPLARLQLRHAEAAATGDGEALSEVAAGYDRTGLHWLAGETSAASLALAPPAHRARWVTADRSILERTAAQADVELPVVWSRGGDRFAPLTQREREITELAAGGWSSPRIAAHLQLSRRTIENHLQHSYRKLGVSSREELAAALGRSAATG